MLLLPHNLYYILNIVLSYLFVIGITRVDDGAVNQVEMIGSSNAEYISLSFSHISNLTIPETAYWLANTAFSSLVNVGTTNFTSIWHLVGLPYSKYGLNLYIDGMRIVVEGADGTNYVNTVIKFGLTSGGTVLLDSDTASINSASVNEDSFTAIKIGSVYEMLMTSLSHVVDNANVLKVMSVEAHCYYA